MGELQSALRLHEAGRESLRKRLVEKEHLLEQTRIAAADKVHSVEQLREEEMGTRIAHREASHTHIALLFHFCIWCDLLLTVGARVHATVCVCVLLRWQASTRCG